MKNSTLVTLIESESEKNLDKVWHVNLTDSPSEMCICVLN